MEFTERRKRSRYMVGTAMNGGISVIILILLFLFALPKYDELSVLVEHINATQAEIDVIRSSGVDVTKFESLVSEAGRRKELSDEVFSDRLRLANVLKKPTSARWDYVEWTTTEASTIDSINEEIANNDRILGNIIPEYVPVTQDVASSIDISPIKHQVNLQTFVQYVEKNILAKYSLTSFAPIGMENITFGSGKTSVVNIGSFRLNIDFTGKDADIYRFVDAIQKSGKLTIREGKLVPSETRLKGKTDDHFSDLSNLLITIQSLTLDHTLDPNSSGKNGGSITLEFYVEGMNYQKILLLRNSLTTRFDALKKHIKEGGDLCVNVNNPVCQDGAGNSAVSAIKNLSRSTGELQQKVDALRRGVVVTDTNAELDNLLTLQATIDSLEKIYERNIGIVNKLKDRINRK